MKAVTATCIAAAMAAAVSLVSATTMVQAQDQAKPNILVIWGDDIGYWNISAYNQGMMGYKTPNIDRLARKGRCSPTTTVSRAALPDAPRSSPARRRSAPAS